MLSVFATLLGITIGYLLSERLNDRKRRREQWWEIYKSLRVLEDLDSDQNADMPIPQYSELAAKHRDIILLNLIRSGLPERKEIIRAVNPMGFIDPKSRSDELKRLGECVLKRLDPEQVQAMKELDIEWARPHGKVEPISPENSEEVIERQ